MRPFLSGPSPKHPNPEENGMKSHIQVPSHGQADKIQHGFQKNTWNTLFTP